MNKASASHEFASSRSEPRLPANAPYDYWRQDVSVITNKGAGDVWQVMASTTGKPLRGTNDGDGWRIRQIGAECSEPSLQQLSQDMLKVGLQPILQGAQQSPGDKPEAVPSDGPGNESTFNVRDSYGRSHKLTLMPSSRFAPEEASFVSASTNRVDYPQRVA